MTITSDWTRYRSCLDWAKLCSRIYVEGQRCPCWWDGEWGTDWSPWSKNAT